MSDLLFFVCLFAISGLLFFVLYALRPQRQHAANFVARLRSRVRDDLSPFYADVFQRFDVNESDYRETLVVVHPFQWFVYSRDGVEFFYLSNQVNAARAPCPANRVNSIVFRLQTNAESEADDNATSDADRPGFSKLQTRCVSHTLDGLLKLFSFANGQVSRTSVDLSHLERYRVEETLDYLLCNRYV